MSVRGCCLAESSPESSLRSLMSCEEAEVFSGEDCAAAVATQRAISRERINGRERFIKTSTSADYSPGIAGLKEENPEPQSGSAPGPLFLTLQFNLQDMDLFGLGIENAGNFHSLSLETVDQVGAVET